MKTPLLILAPMAGITNLPFRLICKEFGADIVYSEMISTDGLCYDSEKTKKLLQTLPDEQPVFFQLFGSKPDNFAKATKIVTDLINPTDNNLTNKLTGIDINFGCPVKKVFKQNAGCALMRDLKLSREIVKAVLENTHLPVSVKIRAGIENISAVRFLKNTADLSWQTVIVHGRTFRQGFSGEIDFEMIGEIKKMFPEKIVIANGAVHTPEDAKTTLARTSADGVALATGILGKPWLFRQIEDYLETGRYETPDIEEIKKVVIRHADYCKKYSGDNFREFRKHLGWYFKGLPGAKKLRQRILGVEKYEDVVNVLKEI